MIRSASRISLPPYIWFYNYYYNLQTTKTNFQLSTRFILCRNGETVNDLLKISLKFTYYFSQKSNTSTRRTQSECVIWCVVFSLFVAELLRVSHISDSITTLHTDLTCSHSTNNTTENKFNKTNNYNFEHEN